VTRYRVETTYPARELSVAGEATYPNRYEAIGAAILEAQREGVGDVVLHRDDCRYTSMKKACPCSPTILRAAR
jgi:hypothetical protein